jgi:hypothetical protein
MGPYRLAIFNFVGDSYSHIKLRLCIAVGHQT